GFWSFITSNGTYSETKFADDAQKVIEFYGNHGYIQAQVGQPQLEVIEDTQDKGTRWVRLKIPVDEGRQYKINKIEFQGNTVHKITFTGNTTTRDAVIRREMRLYEGMVFNTEALKFSIKRLNQLGYFKPLEGKEGDIKVEPTPGNDAQIDIALKFQEQNRNQ